MTRFEVNGDPPALSGKVCEGFVCEGYSCEGELVASANVTYLNFGGEWHRLYFEHRMVFWRPYAHVPKPWDVLAEGWAYPHTDLAASAAIRGQRLIEYVMSDTPNGCRVRFRFENGAVVDIVEDNDVASYAVI
jgi:hypothetical protein